MRKDLLINKIAKLEIEQKLGSDIDKREIGYELKRLKRMLAFKGSPNPKRKK